MVRGTRVLGKLPGLFFCALIILCLRSGGTVDGAVTGGVVIDGDVGIALTDDNFVCGTLDWWPPEKCDYGTCSWGLASILNLDLSHPVLLNAVKAFSPLRIRLGGSLQDKVVYQTEGGHPCTPFMKNSSLMFGFSQGCLPMARWDELNEFFRKTGAEIIFGLNALNGRVRQRDGSSEGPWDHTNAEALIRYTVNKGYKIYGWELGNELSGKGVGTRVGAQQYAADVIKLRSIIDEVYRGSPTKPAVLAPGGFFDAGWYGEFIKRMRPNALNVLTHHIYNLGPGVDEHLVDKILDPTYLDRAASTFNNLQEVIKSGRTSATAWVGESGGAYNSGQHLVTDSFVFSFWFLDQLGMSSKYNTRSYCRQTLVGGNYGLLSTADFRPHPDYYSALLWHRLMGKIVLSVRFTGTNMIRTYAHCDRESTGGVTLLIINLSESTPIQLQINGQTASSTGLKNGTGVPVSRFSRGTNSSKAAGGIREEYHLKAMNGDLHSQTMLLNGNILSVDSSGNIPSLKPVTVDASQPIGVDPFSIVFARFPDFDAHICK